MEPSIRCATWAHAQGVNPLGTAPTENGWLLVPWPQPWPADASEIGALGPVRDAIGDSGIRLQLVVPTLQTLPSVILHRFNQDDDGWITKQPTLACATDDDVVGAAIDLLTARRGETTDVTDVLICSHGRRDRCCGSMGTSLAVRSGRDDASIHRSSHLGGHRFAPTAVILPAATAWAFLDDDTLAQVLDRAGTVEAVLPHYRGSVVFRSPVTQAAEAVVFGEVGWTWLDHRRRVASVDGSVVRIEGIAPTGELRSWNIDVSLGRALPIPECGQPLSQAKKLQSEVATAVCVQRSASLFTTLDPRTPDASSVSGR